MDAITAINQRTSVRRFRSDAVPREVIEQLLECAVRAPNHKLTEPWRFAVLTGRPRIGTPRSGRNTGSSGIADPTTAEAQAGADKVRRECRETPVYIVAMAAVNPDEITREEDYAATMMAVANLMIAAESLGLGTYLKSGGVMQDPDCSSWPVCLRSSGWWGSSRWAIRRNRILRAPETCGGADTLGGCEGRRYCGSLPRHPQQLPQLDRIAYRISAPVVVEVDVHLLAGTRSPGSARPRRSAPRR